MISTFKVWKNISVLFVVLFLFSSSQGYSQIDSLSRVSFIENFNRVDFSIWEVHSKATGMGGFENYELEFKKELKELTVFDAERILSTLKDSLSYRNSRALIFEYNLKFEGYYGNEKVLEIRISTLTGNIYFDDISTGAYYQNSCSTLFAELLIELIENYGFMRFIEDEDLIGLIEVE